MRPMLAVLLTFFALLGLGCEYRPQGDQQSGTLGPDLVEAPVEAPVEDTADNGSLNIEEPPSTDNVAPGDRSDTDPHIVMETHPTCAACVAWKNTQLKELRRRGYRVKIVVKEPWPEGYTLPRFHVVGDTHNGGEVWFLGSQSAELLISRVQTLHANRWQHRSR